ANKPYNFETMSDVRDKPYSWVVSVAAGLMYFIMYGLGRTTGLLFVETLNFFGSDRAAASFPFTLACALRYLSGPIAGALAGRLGLRTMILFGSVIACVGVGGCFFATSITAIAVLWGGLFGLGSGISSTQLPQVNNLYFTKHLTKANGISYAGAAIAGFVLPPILETFLHEYSITGTYLLLSGIALHAIPAAILLKEPPMEKLPMISFEVPIEIRENYKRTISDLSIIYNNTKRKARSLSQILTGGTTQNNTASNMEINLISEPNRNGSVKNKLRSFSNLGYESAHSTVRAKSCSLSLSDNIIQSKTTDGSVNAIIHCIPPFKQSKSDSLSYIKEGEPLVAADIATHDGKVSFTEHILSAKLESFSNAEVNDLIENAKRDAIEIKLQIKQPFTKILTEPLAEIKEHEPLETSNTRPVDCFELQTTASRHASICSKSSNSSDRRNSSRSFTNTQFKYRGDEVLIESQISPNNQLKYSNYYSEMVEDQEEQPPNMCLNDISIFWDIKFLIISLTGSINGFYCFVLPAILIDFCMDKGISTANATYIMMAFSISDMIGRVGFGWITDGKYMTRTNFCAVCFFVLSAGLALFGFMTGLIPMFLVLSVLGLGLGAHTPLPTGLIVEYIDTSKHIMANASFDVLSVPFLLSTPTMIGYFRDQLGSYDLFVYLLCIISFVCGLMMLLLPHIPKHEKKKGELDSNMDCDTIYPSV
ncbi:hypothetical protein JTE90_020447, partial [Oedothorax gibbosus]